jgi:hypothetical protein
MPIEDEHMDVLQNIEFAVASTYRAHRELTDYNVMRVYEALIKRYTAEAAGRTVNEPKLDELEAKLLAFARDMCEWRLGRIPLAGKEDFDADPLDVSTMVRCLRRLLKSVERWNKQGGRQGYLQFMSQYVP